MLAVSMVCSKVAAVARSWWIENREKSILMHANQRSRKASPERPVSLE
eukprot:COSAG05_NODE_6_length_45604_cov_26.489660_15_plen_48_part_00